MADTINHVLLRLSPAAAVHREKLMLRRRADLPEPLIGLPSFNFHTTVDSASPDLEKMLVKGMIQLIALAILDFTSERKEDFTFATLARSTLDGGKFSFEFFCPHMQLVELVNSYHVRRPSYERLANLAIRYKFILLSDLTMPLVFSYQPRNGELLVTNENQTQSPEQFLNPDWCRTTSGFLNFVGTLSMLSRAGDEAHHLERIASKINTVLDQGLDEWLRWLFCLIDTRSLCDTKQIMVDPEDPEKYFYSYPN